ncbi:RluA family pseudouridine synthase [Spiroplasma endosymbiont of Aspidapion aeneum]|uniref:RluA family pseudouridine synthase n=1 Tax=Spiroplasma endosymbiont of Aspidapion aeneum TaxID=3066276 RepID=UPI00313EFA90
MKDSLIKFVNNYTNERLDKVIFNYFLENKYEYSRSCIQKFIEEGQVFVNGYKIIKKNNKVENGANICITVSEQRETDLIPKFIDFKIVYEDLEIMVIDKPNNLVVHPGSGNYTDTLVNAILYHNQNISDVGEKYRPGIVHRIDKQTTGLLVIAKSNYSHQKLSDDFKDRKIYKEYIALVRGVIEEDKGTINAPIGRSKNDRKRMAVTEINSKNAITNFCVLERYSNATLVKVNLLTGRTHQIRVHFEYIKHPIIGDPVYGLRNEKNNLFGQYLHANKLEFSHPKTNEKLSFISQLPIEFSDKIKEIS